MTLRQPGFQVGTPQLSQLPPKRRILIADDDVIFRTVASGLIESWGYDHICVDNGEAALQVLTQERPPTIAILDWLMPKPTGPEICRLIRNSHLAQYIYFVLVSARDGREDALQGLRSGADTYITKPLDAEELRAKLEVADRILVAEESLRDLHTETELFINAVPSILLGTDVEGRINRWNRVAQEVIGLEQADVDGKTFEECGIAWASHGIQNEVLKVLKTGDVCRLNDLAIQREKAVRLVALNIHPLRSHLGNIVGTLIVGADVTEREAREAQLRQAQKLEGIGQLAAGIAHEINTPAQFVSDNVRFFKESWGELSGLVGLLGKLNSPPTREGVTPELWHEIEAAAGKVELDYLTLEIPKALDQTLDGLQRITQIVRAMKDFSHSGSGQKSPTDLNRAIQSTLTISRNEWKYVSEMKVELDPDLPQVPCQADKLKQAILNLVINAAHAIGDVTENGNLGKGLITVRSRKVGDAAEISIADTGTGIPKAIGHRVFEPFFSTKEVGRGTGQGLALAHATIVTEHKGKIWFESEVGKGTTFFIQLPLEESTPKQAASATAK